MAKKCKSPKGRQEQPIKKPTWVDDLKKKLQDRLQSEAPKQSEVPTVQSERQKRKEKQEPTGSAWGVYE